MAIRNRKGKTVAADGTTKRKPGRPRKKRGPEIDPPRPIDGGFHVVFPNHLQFKEKDGTLKNCYFQCEYHMNKYIERYKLDRRKLTIRATDPQLINAWQHHLVVLLRRTSQRMLSGLMMYSTSRRLALDCILAF